MRSVVVCGSKRYAKEIKNFCDQLIKAGVLVFEPNIYEHTEEAAKFETPRITKAVFKGFTLEHFDWIKKADVCFIFNKSSYVGVSVSMEIGYATALGKPVFALSSKTGDPCRDALIDKVAPDVKSLISLLQ